MPEMGADTRAAGTGRPIVFFDGGCPLCRREIAHYRRLDAAGAIDWRDIHADAAVLDRWGISWEWAMQRLHAITPEGKVCSGAPAFVLVWRHLPGYRWPGRLLHRLPPLARLMDRAYSVFARRRWRSRCAGGLCHPDR